MKNSKPKYLDNTSKKERLGRIPPLSYFWIRIKIKCASLSGKHFLCINYISHENEYRLMNKGFEVFRNRYPSKSMISW